MSTFRVLMQELLLLHFSVGLLVGGVNVTYLCLFNCKVYMV